MRGDGPSARTPDGPAGAHRPDVVILMTDQERAAPPYESAELRRWRSEALRCERWFAEHAVRFERHYTGSLASVPSRATLLTGQYPDVHGVTQTDGLAERADDTRMRWLRPDEVPTVAIGSAPAAMTPRYSLINACPQTATIGRGRTGRICPTCARFKRIPSI